MTSDEILLMDEEKLMKALDLLQPRWAVECGSAQDSSTLIHELMNGLTMQVAQARFRRAVIADMKKVLQLLTRAANEVPK